jgi:hypothetical protein
MKYICGLLYGLPSDNTKIYAAELLPIKLAGLFLPIILSIFLCIAPCFNAKAYARENRPANDLEFGAWRSALRGSLGFANAGFDLKSDFKKNASFDPKTVMLPGYTYNIGYYSDIRLRSNLIKNYGEMKAYAANNVLINNIGFGAGGVSNLIVDMRFSDIELLASRELAANDRNGFADLIYGAKAIRFSVDLSDKDFKMINNYLRKVIVPVAGVHAKCKINDNFKLYMWLYAGSAKTGGYNYKTADLDAGIEYHFTPRAPEYREIGDNPKAEKFSLTPQVGWHVKLGYKERYFRETAGANVIKIGHSGPEIKFSARF